MLLYSLTILKDYRGLRGGRSIEFDPNVTLLVGDQGTGKSTILKLILENGGKEGQSKLNCERCSCFIWDSEHDNPRTRDPHAAPEVLFSVCIVSRFKSHGESQLPLVSLHTKRQDSVILLDEPETSLSPQSMILLGNTFDQSVSQGNQLVVATHHPYLMCRFGRVFDLGSWCWIDTESYLKSIGYLQ